MKNTGTVQLKTKRLLLRKIRLRDFFTFQKWYRLPQISYYSQGESQKSLRQSIGFILRRVYNYYFKRRNSYYQWAIDKDGRMIGYVGLNGDEKKEYLSIFYMMAPEHQRNGYVKEAVAAVLQYMKTQNYRFLYGTCNSKNTASYRILQDCGFEWRRRREKVIHYPDGRCGDREVFIYRLKDSDKKTMRETIIQFGEGNFFRAFADDFIDELNKKGLYDGKIVIVKPTPRGDLEKFKAQHCTYNLFIRGMENGERVSRSKEVNAISRAVNPYQNYDAFLALAHNPEMRFIISNTTEAGIVYDDSCQLTDQPALSFPGKLTQLLYERWRTGFNGFVLLPCELIDKNGDALKECVLRYAKQWELGDGFLKWIETENTFCNTLVDRIVTGYPKEEAEALCAEIGYDDKLLDTAEPYHLWAIEGNFENELPLQKAGFNVKWTDDITPLKKRKVRLLNGAHTVMVFPALLCGIATVGESVKDEDVSAFLNHYLYQTAIPVLGDNEENRAFAKAVSERFANPFIQHQLTAIALNSVSKYAVRVLPTALDYKAQFGTFPKEAALSLAALIYYYKNRQPQDEAAATEFIKNNDIAAILSADLFGSDLSEMLPEVTAAYEMIESGNIREGLLWAIS